MDPLSKTKKEQVKVLRVQFNNNAALAPIINELDAAIDRYFYNPLNREVYQHLNPQFCQEFIKQINAYDIGKITDSPEVLTRKAKAFISQLGTHVPRVNQQGDLLKEFLELVGNKSIQGFIDEINQRISDVNPAAGNGFYALTPSKDALEIYTALHNELKDIPLELMKMLLATHDIGLWFVPTDEDGIPQTGDHPYAAYANLKLFEEKSIPIFNINNLSKATKELFNQDEQLLNRLIIINSRGHLGITSPALGENSPLFLLLVGAEDYAKPLAENETLSKAYASMLVIMAACDVSSVSEKGLLTPDIVRSYLEYKNIVLNILSAVKSENLPEIPYTENGGIDFSKCNAKKLLEWIFSISDHESCQKDTKHRLGLVGKNTDIDHPSREEGQVWTWIKEVYLEMGITDWEPQLNFFFNHMLAGEFFRSFIQHILLKKAAARDPTFHKEPSKNNLSKLGLRFLLRIAQEINEKHKNGDLSGLFAFQPTGQVRAQGYDPDLAAVAERLIVGLLNELVPYEEKWNEFFLEYLTICEAPELNTRRVLFQAREWLESHEKDP